MADCETRTEVDASEGLRYRNTFPSSDSSDNDKLEVSCWILLIQVTNLLLNAKFQRFRWVEKKIASTLQRLLEIEGAKTCQSFQIFSYECGHVYSDV